MRAAIASTAACCSASEQPRKNGLACPLHPFQLLSYVLFVLFVVFLYAFQLLYLDVPGRAALGCVYGVCVVVAIVGGAVATGADPADPCLHSPPQWDRYDDVPDRLFCYRCERHVPSSSKHCTVCQKCVGGFDHHCIWLNNCIGAANYLPFLTLLIGAAMMLAVQIGYGVYHVVVFSISPSAFDERGACGPRRAAAMYAPQQTAPPLPRPCAVRDSVSASLSGAAFFGVSMGVSALAVAALGLVLQVRRPAGTRTSSCAMGLLRRGEVQVPSLTTL